MTLFKTNGWNSRQIDLHRKLYLEYRKQEVIEYIDLFLSVNHPEWAIEQFVEDFVNNKRTIRQMFARVLICGGDLSYHHGIPYQKDMERYIGFMRLRQYIKITENMFYRDIMNLDRVFDLTVHERNELRSKLLKHS